VTQRKLVALTPAAATMGYKPSPRPAFDVPTLIRAEDAVRHVWGDEESGRVRDWIYVSSQRVHALVFGLVSGEAFRHSESFRTVFAADELLHVLTGTLVLANPATGEVVRAERGESVFFRRDTWHHGFSYGSDELLVLEFFAPPPAAGTSGAYARTKPYLAESVYADDRLLGRSVGAGETPSFRVLRPSDVTWRLDRGVLVGLLVSTEHLTVGTMRVLPGDRSVEESHAGDELCYVTSGSLRIAAGGVDATLNPGDGFYVPAGVPHGYYAVGPEVANAIFGVAPEYAPAAAKPGP
jgi:quercetin dioxygenase-like cupin family protein